MPEINLAAEVFRARLIARRRRVLYLVTIGGLLLVLGAWGLPYYLATQVREEIAGVDAEIRSIEARLLERREEVRRIDLFKRQLSLLKERLGTRLGWSRVLETFERLSPPDVSFRKISGTAENGQIDIDVAAGNLDTAADLIVSLERGPGFPVPPFTNVQMVGASRLEQAADVGKLLVRLRLFAVPALFRVTAVEGGER